MEDSRRCCETADDAASQQTTLRDSRRRCKTADDTARQQTTLQDSSRGEHFAIAFHRHSLILTESIHVFYSRRPIGARRITLYMQSEAPDHVGHRGLFPEPQRKKICLRDISVLNVIGYIKRLSFSMDAGRMQKEKSTGFFFSFNGSRFTKISCHYFIA